MQNLKSLSKVLIILTFLFTAVISHAAEKITTIHLDEYNGYFAAKETLNALKPGKYKFVVTNKANKLVGFLLQDGKTHERLTVFPIQPGETHSEIVDISDNGFRYRCPINPTPWYDVSVSH